MSTPKRITLRRTKGWRKPEGAVVVSRPSKWGNPYVVHQHTDACGEWHDACPTYPCDDAADAVRRFRHDLLFPVMGQPVALSTDDIRTELAGKDLCCWCPETQPCHGDVLLRIAAGEDI